jgi:hypothetical protein
LENRLITISIDHEKTTKKEDEDDEHHQVHKTDAAKPLCNPHSPLETLSFLVASFSGMPWKVN